MERNEGKNENKYQEKRELEFGVFWGKREWSTYTIREISIRNE